MKSLDLFRERLDYTVENAIPVHIRFGQKLESLVKANALFLQSQSDNDTVTYIKGLVAFADGNEPRQLPTAPSASPAPAAVPDGGNYDAMFEAKSFKKKEFICPKLA